MRVLLHHVHLSYIRSLHSSLKQVMGRICRPVDVIIMAHGRWVGMHAELRCLERPRHPMLHLLLHHLLLHRY